MLTLSTNFAEKVRDQIIYFNIACNNRAYDFKIAGNLGIILCGILELTKLIALLVAQTRKRK